MNLRNDPYDSTFSKSGQKIGSRSNSTSLYGYISLYLTTTKKYSCHEYKVNTGGWDWQAETQQVWWIPLDGNVFRRERGARQRLHLNRKGRKLLRAYVCVRACKELWNFTLEQLQPLPKLLHYRKPLSCQNKFRPTKIWTMAANKGPYFPLARLPTRVRVILRY